MTKTITKTSEEIVKGCPHGERNRAGTLRKVAIREGMMTAAMLLENELAQNADLTDTELMHLVSTWIKEMKQ